MKVSKALVSFIILGIIYASVNLIAAPPRSTLEQYNVSSSTLRLINLTVIVPVIAIWFIGLYGYKKLHEYTAHIKDNKEGRHVVLLTKGVMYLTYSLPIISTLSAIMNLIARDHPNLKAGTTIVINYATLLSYLLAFWFISRGGRKLSELAKKRPGQGATHILTVFLIIAAVTFSYLIATTHADMYTIYHMPVLLVLTTIVMPYIFSWYLGIFAAYEIFLYTQTVNGAIYRKSWNSLAYGIIWLLSFSVLLQYITAVSAKLSSLSLGLLLVLIYSILTVRAIGYLFIGRGAKKLTKIEEV